MARLAHLVLAAVLALLLVPAGAGADAYFGYNDNTVIRRELDPVRDSALLARSGADSARITIEWMYASPGPHKLDLSLYDRMYRTITRRGLRPLIVVMAAPKWAWPRWTFCLEEACHFPPDRAYDADWARLLATVAQRYPAAAAIEVWNEPNIRLFFSTGPDPQRYTELLRIAHDAVKRVRPKMPVLGGALAPDRSDRTTESYWGMRPFLRGMYAAGARGLMDGISLHPYPQGRFEGGTYETIDRVLQVRDEARDRVPLWLTEVGMTTTGAAASTPRQQALVLGDLIPRLLRRPYIRGVYVHTLLDPQVIPRENPEAGYGVLRTPTLPKPAFCSLAAAVSHAPAHCKPLRPPPAFTAIWDAQETLQSAVEAALAYRRRAGTYSGLSSAALHKLDDRLAAAIPDSAAPPGAQTDPARIAVIAVPGGAGVRLCNSAKVGRSFCVTIYSNADWRFTAAPGSIDAAATAADSPDSPQW